MRRLGVNRPDRILIAYLGNGVSNTAVKDGQSIDPSMGLTPPGGVIMGTRCGDIDPGVLVYLMHEKNLGAAGSKRWSITALAFSEFRELIVTCGAYMKFLRHHFLCPRKSDEMYSGKFPGLDGDLRVFLRGEDSGQSE